MFVVKGPSTGEWRPKKLSLGQRLLRGSNAADTLNSDPTAPRSSPNATLKILATTSTAAIPVGCSPSSTSISTVSRDQSHSGAPESSPTYTLFGSDTVSRESSSVKGSHRKFSHKLNIGGRSSADLSKPVTPAAASDFNSITSSLPTAPPSGHIAWQVEQFLSAFGVDPGLQSESAALIYAFKWAKEELNKRAEETKRWKARSEGLLQNVTPGDGIKDNFPPSEASGSSDTSTKPLGPLQQAWDRNEQLDAEVKRMDILSQKRAKDLKAAQDEIEKLTQELQGVESLKKENSTLRQKFTEANNGWNENYAKTVTLSNELQKARETLATGKATNIASVDKIAALKAELDAAERSRKLAEGKATNLQQSIQAIKANHEAALSKAKVDKKTQVPRLQTRVAELSAEVSKYKSELAQAKKSWEADQARVAELNAQLADKDSDLKKTEGSLRDAVSRRDCLEVTVKNETARVETLRKAKDAEIKKKDKDLKQKDEALQQQKSKVWGLERQARQRDADVRQAEASLDSAQKEIKELEKRVKDGVQTVNQASPKPHIPARHCHDQDYAELVAKVKHLNEMREALEKHDAPATKALVKQCNIDTTSGFKSEIPDDLIDVIERIGSWQYELAFPLTKLRDLDRAARGISADARMALVQISLGGPTPEYCVHIYPVDKEKAHKPFVLGSTSARGPEHNICAAEPSRLVYQIYRYLFMLLQGSGASLSEIYRAVDTIINKPASACLVCAKPTQPTSWRAVPCGDECRKTLGFAPLAVHLPELTVDPPVLDLLLHFLYNAAADGSSLDLAPGCPIGNKTQLMQVIDSFPAVDSPNLVQEIYGSGAASGSKSRDWAAERWRLVRWICDEFQGFLVSAPEGMKVPSMPGARQFVLVNGNLGKEKEFAGKLSGGKQGGVAFHGTATQRGFRILTEGLKVMSNTPFMAYGAAQGEGLYLAAEPSKSLPYAHVAPRTWKGGKYGQTKLMLGCEVAGWSHYANTVHVAKDSGNVMVRYVFLLPQQFRAPISGHVEPAMRSAFAGMRVKAGRR